MTYFPTALVLGALTVLLGAMTQNDVQAAPKPHNVLNFTVQDIAGNDVPLSQYKGKVLLIVNTASLCGNTPQYASLEKMYLKYKNQGFEILAFPANNFGHQEPGSNTQIRQFCTLQYKTTFPLFTKISVKGDDQAPLYKFLTDKQTDPQFGGEIEWNFAKFLINRKGEIVGRFQAGHDPMSADVVKAVEDTLKQR